MYTSGIWQITEGSAFPLTQANTANPCLAARGFQQHQIKPNPVKHHSVGHVVEGGPVFQ